MLTPVIAANLQRLIRPKSIATFGGGWAEEVARQLRKIGYAGPVYPVHPKKDEVAGFRAYRTVAELPQAPDASFVGVNRELTIEVMRDLAARGAGGAVCFAAGFKEAGDKGQALHDQLLAAAGDMAFMGPNCYGILNYLDGASLWPDQHGGARVERGVAMISQSGNIGVNMTMQMRGMPLAYLFTLGNQARVGFSGLIEALLEDHRVTAIGLVMEAIDDVAGFERAALKARERRIPVAVMKLGASERGAAAALSHTASLAGSDQAVDAFFARLGIARLKTLPSLIETMKLLHFVGPLDGRTVSSMSCSGGEAALMSDLLDGRDLVAKPFTAEQQMAVEATLSELVTVANPLDYHTFIWGNEARLTATFEAVMRARFDLSLLVLDFPRGDRCSDASWHPTLRGFAEAARRTGSKAALVASLGELMPERIVAAAAELGPGRARWPRRRPRCGGSSGDHRRSLPSRRRRAAAATWRRRWSGTGARRMDGEAAAGGIRPGGAARPAGALPKRRRRGLRGAGCPRSSSRPARSTMLHKTEAGGVRLGIASAEDAGAAAAAMLKLAPAVIVEEMVADAVAELIVGVTRDPQFGPMLVVGSGGILVELVGDSRTLLLPTTREDVAGAIRGLKTFKLIAGFRGRPPGDLEGAVDAVMAIAGFATRQRQQVVGTRHQSADGPARRTGRRRRRRAAAAGRVGRRPDWRGDHPPLPMAEAADDALLL